MNYELFECLSIFLFIRYRTLFTSSEELNAIILEDIRKLYFKKAKEEQV